MDYLSRFELTRVLNQDRGGLRVALEGTIDDQLAVVLLERAAFDVSNAEKLTRNLVNFEELGHNYIYRWFMASEISGSPDIKISYTWPATEAHVKKYTKQLVRQVTETPEIYRNQVKRYMETRRGSRLEWVYNILEGKAEEENVVYRQLDGDTGFLLTADLNWDRKTMTSMHLLGLVQRCDIWSVRDLKRKHVPWLKDMHAKLLKGATSVYYDVESDQLKTYIHYQPTYYHFHIHVVHVEHEGGFSQATGKALGLENVISQLETMAGDSDEAGMEDVTLTYTLGEESDLWKNVFLPLREQNSAIDKEQRGK
ncbi:MAG: hypothetical protein M1814_000208 [Vezdaea aestivalis]|nr:MAG: hypothetical protein M1814_000208 [Vezdaea aestivalis]